MSASEKIPPHLRRSARRAALVRARRRRRLSALAATLALAGLAAGIALALGSGAAGTHRAHRPVRLGARRPPAHGRFVRPSPQPGASALTGLAGAGRLAQTHAYPSDSSAQFKALMATLWQAIARDSPRLALPAFFPQAAYVQLKAIESAASDWRQRLVGELQLDIAAAHALLGAGAARARLLAVNVPSQYGHWVEPGACYNRIGYYEVPNARLVYAENGGVHSFGIASMISWRGVWYVVHLGSVLRSGAAGVVDEPASGPGTSAYSSTC
jgi:hypothetical protein